MADEPGRTPEDINIAVGITEVVTRRGHHLQMEPLSLFVDLTTRVQLAVTGGVPFLTRQRSEQLSQSLGDTTRLYDFFARNKMPFVLALQGMTNVFNAPVVVDVFSPRALQGLGADSEPPPVDNPQTWRDWEPLIKRLIKEGKVKRVGYEEAYGGTIALFVDTLRALARGSVGRGAPPFAAAGGGGGSAASSTPTASTTTAFTVHSANSGYQLDYFPQYRYTPTVFGGAKLSTPVSQTIANGHYCFEGRMGGTTTRDLGVHYAGPGSASTRTTAF